MSSKAKDCEECAALREAIEELEEKLKAEKKRVESMEDKIKLQVSSEVDKVSLDFLEVKEGGDKDITDPKEQDMLTLVRGRITDIMKIRPRKIQKETRDQACHCQIIRTGRDGSPSAGMSQYTETAATASQRPQTARARSPDRSWREPKGVPAHRQMYGKDAVIRMIKMEEEEPHRNVQNQEKVKKIHGLFRWQRLFSGALQMSHNHVAAHPKDAMKTARQTMKVGERLTQCKAVVDEKKRAQKEIISVTRSRHLQRVMSAAGGIDETEKGASHDGSLSDTLGEAFRGLTRSSRPQTARTSRTRVEARPRPPSASTMTTRTSGTASSLQDKAQGMDHPGGEDVTFRTAGGSGGQRGPVYCLNPSIVSKYMPTRLPVKEAKGGFKTREASPRLENISVPMTAGEESTKSGGALHINDFGSKAQLHQRPHAPHTPMAPPFKASAKVQLKPRPHTAGPGRHLGIREAGIGTRDVDDLENLGIHLSPF